MLFVDNFILDFLSTNFQQVQPRDFYRFVFPVSELAEAGKQVQGKYNGVALELLPEATEGKNVRRYLLHDDLADLDQLLKSENFIIVSPISYIGASRRSENARNLYALAIDLDGITSKQYIVDLFHQIDNKILPRPTFTVASGTGLHLYFVLDKPIRLFPDTSKELFLLKKELVNIIWNRYTTELYKNVQHGSLFQGFRLVGGTTKHGTRVKAFLTGEKIDIDYLLSFAPELKEKTKRISKQKKNYNIAEAQELFPEWYNNRVIEKKPKGTWTTKRDLYDWWKRKNNFWRRR